MLLDRTAGDWIDEHRRSLPEMPAASLQDFITKHLTQENLENSARL
jgi:hypothetical protein